MNLHRSLSIEASFLPMPVVMRRLAALALMALVFLPSLAFAGAAPTAGAPFVVQQDDYFVNYLLKGLLGDVIQVNAMSAQATLTGAGTLGDVFRIFNLGVAFFGSIVIMFISVVGILNTGHDGEFLGKRWSSFWVPFRFAAGAAMMLPVTNSGYSFVQALCMWIAGQGVGFADALWTQVLAMNVKTGAQIVAPVATSGVVNNMAVSELCTAYVNRSANVTIPATFNWFHQTNATEGVHEFQGVWWRPSITGALTGYGAAIAGLSPAFASNLYAYVPGALNGQDVCGRLTFKFAPDAQDPQDKLRARLAVVHMNETSRIRNVLKPLAENVVAQAFNGTDATMQAAGQALANAVRDETAAYMATLTAEAQAEINASVLGSNGKLQPVMEKMGFAVAGAFYMELSKTANAVRNGISAVPTYDPPRLDLIARDYGAENWEVIRDRIAELTGTAAVAAAANSGAAAGGAGATTTVRTIDLNENMFNALDGGWTNWSHSIAMAILQSVIQVGSTNNAGGGPLSAGLETGNYNNLVLAGDPSMNYSVIMQLKNKGDTILNVAGTLYTGYIMASATTKAANSSIIGAAANAVAPLGKMLGAILENLSLMIFTLVMGLITLGILLAVIIPMTPFMIWAMGIAGLLVLIVESLVASVIWAVMLMHPSGEGVTSDYSRQGLMILLMLFVRPSLMIMGLVCGIFLVDPMVNFINDLFYFVFKSTQKDTMTGLFIIFGICSVYVTLVLSVVRKSFAMIHMVPDRVLRWIGGGAEQLGESEAADRGESLAGTAGQRVSNLGQTVRPSMVQNDRARHVFATAAERKQAAMQRLIRMRTGNGRVA